ncbi:MAG: restriction endonuclease [Verrucomicrobiales bacterium]|nr:restriction endonuclease [Verrucomicrobiales bacterium]
MRQAMVNANPDLADTRSKYVMRITGDNDQGKAQLDIRSRETADLFLVLLVKIFKPGGRAASCCPTARSSARA